jgi:hypothetical protein
MNIRQRYTFWLWAKEKEREGKRCWYHLETYIYEEPGTALQGSTVIPNGLDITSDHYGKISTKNDIPSIIKGGEYE